MFTDVIEHLQNFSGETCEEGWENNINLLAPEFYI
jgi:hypothetical protein